MKPALALLALFLTACAGNPTAPATVKVPVYMPCATDIPARPSFPADALTDNDDLWTTGTALWADRKARQAYEAGLEVRLNGCVNPPESKQPH